MPLQLPIPLTIDKERQTSIPGGEYSILFSMVEPVVVMPDMDSKSVKLRFKVLK